MLRPAKRQVWMIISVIADLVSFIDNAAHEAGMMLCVYAHEKKRRFHLGRF